MTQSPTLLYVWNTGGVETEKVSDEMKKHYKRRFKRVFPQDLGKITIAISIMGEERPKSAIIVEALYSRRQWSFSQMLFISGTIQDTTIKDCKIYSGYFDDDVYKYIIPKKEVVNMINTELRSIKYSQR